MISRVYYKLLPNTESIKQCLKDIQMPEGPITRRATLKHAASRLQGKYVP
jgi:tetrahydromethanopterin S-methyltransferase subunit F